METKPLLYGLIGFFIGGLTVSLAATYQEPRNSPMTIDKVQSAWSSPTSDDPQASQTTH